MMGSFWTKLSRYAAGGAAALLLTAGTVRAEESVAELKARLDAQQKQIEHLQKIVESSGLRPIHSPSETDREAIKAIVDDYLKQPKPEQPKVEWLEVGKDTRFNVTFSNGVHFSTSDGAFRAALRGRWQFDTGFAGNTNDALLGGALSDGVLFRRVRLGLQGTIWEVADFVAELDFAPSGDVQFREIWMGVSQLPIIGNARVGHFKEFFSLEQLTSSRYLSFIERSIIDSAFVEGYDPGFQIYRNLGTDDRIFVGTGLHTTASDNGAHAFTNDRWNWTSRVSVLPVWDNNGRCLVHLGAAAALKEFNADVGTGDTTEGARVRNFRARPYRIDPQSFLSTGNIFSTDGWNVYGLEAAAVFGPFSVQAEYMYNHVENAFVGGAQGVSLGNLDYDGFYLFVSYFLTGEHRTYDRRFGTFTRQSVNEPFFLVKGEDGCLHRGRGAWEILARYGYLDLNDSSGPARAGRLYQYTIGVNWYWNPNMKVQWNYEYLNANKGTGNIDANTFVMRFSWDF